jgi:hypothetical protein
MKRFAVIALFLALGALANVAVAWACAAWIIIPPAGMRTAWVDIDGLERVNGWKVSVKQTVFATQVVAMVRVTIDDDGTPASDVVPRWSDVLSMMDQAVQATKAEMAAMERAGINAPIGPSVIMQKAYGWPCCALYWNWDNGAYKVNTPPGEPITRAIALPQRPNPPGSFSLDDARALPTAIIPIGFIMNTLLFATALWLLIPGPLALRRAIRRRRGRCVKCGYDLRGVEHERCPECGLAVAGT